MGYSILASVACPAVTFGSVILITTPFASHSPDAFGLLGAWMGASLVGALFAAPLGSAFGALFAMIWRLLDGARVDGRSARESVWMRFGLALVALGSVVWVVSASTPPMWPMVHWPPAPPWSRPDYLALLGLFTASLGMLTFGYGLVRFGRRLWFAARVRRGAVEGYALVPLAQVEDAQSLPRLFEHGPAQHVLVRREAAARGPFRSHEPTEALGRM